jgi:hypothetical protein
MVCVHSCHLQLALGCTHTWPEACHHPPTSAVPANRWVPWYKIWHIEGLVPCKSPPWHAYNKCRTPEGCAGALCTWGSPGTSFAELVTYSHQQRVSASNTLLADIDFIATVIC